MSPSNLLERGQAWLGQQLTTHAGTKVIYRRDELLAQLTATIGRSPYEQEDGNGLITTSQVRDYLIDTAELLSSVIGSLPKRGDQIIETDGRITFVFEVMSLGNDPPWRYSDPFRLKLRIHTKQIPSQG